MTTIIPLSNQTLSLDADQNYQIVDNQGNPVETLDITTQGEQMIVRDAANPENYVILENYQQSHIIAPNGTVVPEALNDVVVVASEVSKIGALNISPSVLWWSLGGLALIGGGVALFSGGSKSPARPAQPDSKLNNLTDDNILNGAEAQSLLSLSGEVRNVPTNANLQLLLDNTPLATEITLNGTQFSAQVEGSVLAQGSRLSLVVSDSNGKTLTQSDLNYQVKLSTSENLEAGLGTVTADNQLNQAEQAGTVDITLNVSGLESGAQATVALLDNGKIIATTSVSENGNITFNVAGSALSSGTLSAQVQAVDFAGNVAEASATRTYQIDTHINTPTISLEPINGNNIITHADSKNTQLPLTFHINGLDADSQATLTLYNNGKMIGTAPVAENGEIILPINGADLLTENLSYTLNARDNVGNTAQTSGDTALVLDTAFPMASVNITQIAENGVINAEKAAQEQTVLVDVSNVTDGAVTSVVLKDGDTVLGEQLVTENSLLRFKVAGSALTSGRLRAEYRTVANDGESRDAQSTKEYIADLTITTPTVTVSSIAGDNVITAAEQKADIPVVVRVANLDSDAQAVVTLTDGTHSWSENVSANGNVTFNLEPALLNGGELRATIVATDHVGNRAENQSQATAYRVKNSVARPTIEIESVAGDNTVNIAKAAQKQPVAVKLSDLEAGASADIVLSVGDKTIGSLTDVKANGSYNIEVNGADLTAAVKATVTAKDAYNQTASHSATQTLSVDTSLNLPTVTLDNVAVDNIVSFSELDKALPLNLTVSGLDNDATARIEIYNGAEKVGEFSSNKNGTFTTNLIANKLTADGQLSAKVFVSDGSGNSKEGSAEALAYRVDTHINTPTVTVSSIAGDNVITAAEQKADIPVVVRVANLDSDAQAVVTLSDGTHSWSENVSANGNVIFNLEAALLNGGELRATIVATDHVGNRAENQSQATAYRVKNSVARPTIEIESVAGDNTVNIAKAAQKQPVAVKLSDLEAGASADIVLSVGDKTIGSLTDVKANGSYNIEVNGADLTAAVKATVTAKDAYNQTASHSATQTLSVDTSLNLPTVTLDNVAGDNIVSFSELDKALPLNLSLSGLDNDATARIEIYNGAEKVGEFSSNKNGTFTTDLTANKLTADGQLSAKVFVSDGSGNSKEGSAAALAYSVKTEADKPSVRFVKVAGDDVLSHSELSQSVPVELAVSGLAQGTSGTLVVKNGTETLQTLNVNANQHYRISVPGEKLAAGQLSAELSVTDTLGNRAQSDVANAVYQVDTETEQPRVSLVSVAGIRVSNQTLAGVISTREADTENVAVVVNVSGLETGGSATVTLSGAVSASQSVTQNGDVTFNVARSALDSASEKRLNVAVSAQDKYQNPAKTAQDQTAYEIDLVTSTPQIEIISIGGEVQYELFEHQINQQQIPVKFKISGMDSDASARLSAKIGNEEVSNLSGLGNGEHSFNLTAEQLAKGDKLVLAVVALDENDNRANAEAEKEYIVHNFIKIKQIDADFNITYGDTRQAGVVIEGQVNLDLKLNDDYWYLHQNINQGDVWRWADSVTITFENGKSYKVPVTHQDEDDDIFTADEPVVNYALALTASEWRELGGQAFSVTPNRLADRAGKPFSTLYYDKSDKAMWTERFGNGNTLQTLEMKVKQHQNADIGENSNENSREAYPYTLAKYDPKTFISGFAVGDDVQPGDTVTIKVGDQPFTTVLKADKTFYIEVPTDVLLNNPTTTVTATLDTQSGVSVTPDQSGYLSAAITPNIDQSGSVNNGEGDSQQTGASLDTIGDKAWDELPYFIRALSYREKLSYGYVRNHTSGGAITIKYSFADPQDAATLAYMQEYNRHSEQQFQYNIEGMQRFSEANKQVVRDALKKIADRTKITFVEESGFLEEGTGMNFFIFPLYGQNTSGFAQEGGNVRLNADLFQRASNSDAESISPINAGVKTTLHEIMHALGMSHPFLDNHNDAEHNDHHIHDVDDIHEQDILTKAEDRAMLTLMSYTYDISSYGDDLRPFDLATLHYRYGVNASQRSGNDIYTFKEFNKRAADGDIYIWDGGGVDTFNAANEQQAVYVNLTPGSWIYSGKKADTLVADGLDSVAEQDFFNDKALELQLYNGEIPNKGWLEYVFNELYPSYVLNSGQAFIGYGTVIENAVGSDFDDTLIGNDADNLLEGGKGKDRLVGGKGNDVLNGGEGADIMEGGEDDDIYFVDDAGDRIIEAKDEGDDKVFSTVSIEKAFEHVEAYQLLGRENLEIDAGYVKIIEEIPRSEDSTSNVVSDSYGRTIETIEDDGYRGIRTITRINSTDLRLTGNAGDNKLVGGDGNDVIDGGEGADVMIGGFGNDVYYVDHENDVVEEKAGQGTDTVRVSTASFKVPESIEKIEMKDEAKVVHGEIEYRVEIEGNSDENHFELDLSRNAELTITGNGSTANHYQFSLKDFVLNKDDGRQHIADNDASTIRTEPLISTHPEHIIEDLQFIQFSGQNMISGKYYGKERRGLILTEEGGFDHLDHSSIGDDGQFSFLSSEIKVAQGAVYELRDEETQHLVSRLEFDENANHKFIDVKYEVYNVSPYVTLMDYKSADTLSFKVSHGERYFDNRNVKTFQNQVVLNYAIEHRYDSDTIMVEEYNIGLVAFNNFYEPYRVLNNIEIV